MLANFDEQQEDRPVQIADRLKNGVHAYVIEDFFSYLKNLIQVRVDSFIKPGHFLNKIIFVHSKLGARSIPLNDLHVKVVDPSVDFFPFRIIVLRHVIDVLNDLHNKELYRMCLALDVLNFLIKQRRIITDPRT